MATATGIPAFRHAQDDSIASGEPQLAHLEASEAIALEGIGPCEVEDQVRLDTRQSRVEPQVQGVEVLGISRPVGKLDIEIATLLVRRVVARP